MMNIQTKAFELRIMVSKDEAASDELPWKWDEREGYVLHSDGPFVGGTGPGLSYSFLSATDIKGKLMERTAVFPWGRMILRFNNRVVASQEILISEFETLVERS